jgi:hypothetical protein
MNTVGHQVGAFLLHALAMVLEHLPGARPEAFRMPVQTSWITLLRHRYLECPAFYVPVLVRETGRKGADDGEGQEAYS